MLAAMRYYSHGKGREDNRFCEPPEPSCFRDEPDIMSLFGLCMRHFVLKEERTNGLPKQIIDQIGCLKYDMEIIVRTHQDVIPFKISWIAVGKNGKVDCRKTYVHCYREMPADDFFIFAAINGIASGDLWKRLDQSEQRRVSHSGNGVIRNTTILMFHPVVFNVLQLKSVIVAAEKGWSGALCAWIGLKNDTLCNNDYREMTRGFENPCHRPLGSSPLSENAILSAIYDGQYHLLRYLPTLNLTVSFEFLFPKGQVPLCFFHNLVKFPVIESLFNDKLVKYLESVARDVLIWMPLPEIQRLQRMAAGFGEIEIRDFIDQILNNIRN